MIVIDADRCHAALAFDRLIPALAEAFVAGCRMPERQVYDVATRPAGGEPAPSRASSRVGHDAPDAPSGLASDQGRVLIMPAWTDGGLLGIKTVNVFPGNAALGLPALHATYTLYDARTGEPLAALDGDVITARRTAATSALAASRLLPAAKLAGEPLDLCIVGAGRVARWLPAAFAAVARLGRVRIWNRAPDSARKLASLWQTEGLAAESVTAVDDLAAAVRESDLVSCATLATEPLIEAGWLAADSHLDLIGSFTPAMQEATPACLTAADVWIDIPAARQKAGELIAASAAGVVVAPATLADLLRDTATPSGARRPGRRTVFKAVGSALADLAAAGLIWRSHQGNR